MGNVPGEGLRKLLHLRRMSVCRGLVLNKKENGQNFFSRRFGDSLFPGGGNIRGRGLDRKSTRLNSSHM